MATFTPEEIDFIKTRGNDYCRRVWLGLYEGESVNFTDEQSVKDFMSDKYEKKRYYLESQATTVVNGNSSIKNKGKVKTAASTPLISISPQSSKSLANNNTVNTSRGVTNNVLANMNDGSSKLARPVINYPQPVLSNINIPAPAMAPPVPE
jgi:Arf-GAP domain and FG repeats-containing protein 1